MASPHRLSTRIWSAVFGFVLVLGLVRPGAASEKVPVRFDDYHGYTGTVKVLRAVAEAYPEITELIEIGRSTMGRPIYVLVVSNIKTGETIDRYVKLRNMRREGVKNVPPMKSYQGKPGHWICGATHGNEHTGTEVCLYIIDRLVSSYGRDPELTRLVDDQVFYICPVLNPDGVVNTVEKGISQRQNSMMKDDDGDGRINEDGPDDLNGDGVVTMFRYRDPEGRYVIDEKDPRVMVRLGEKEETDKARYSMIPEDRDNDGDGKRGEDSERGIDLNRNFPEEWFTEEGMPGGSGDYPTSAPEVHAAVEFLVNHPNILMAQFYHTSGGFTFRPLGTAPHPRLHPKDVAVFDFIMGKKYLEIIGEEIPEAWKDPASIEKLREKLKETSKNKYAIARGYELPRGWRVSYHEQQDRRYAYGMATDWMYMQYGAYSVTTELWNPEKDIEGFPEISEGNRRVERERALLKYQDEHYGGKLFVPWKPYRHPELGEGEIGGWIPKVRGNALPGKPLLNVCEKHWRFERFRAGLQPEVVISDAEARVLVTADKAREAKVSGGGEKLTIKKGPSKEKVRIVEVTATIENRGKLPTHVARGADLPGNREDVVWLIGDRDKVSFLQGTAFQRLGVLEGAMPIPGYRERGEPSARREGARGGMLMMMPFRRPGRERLQPIEVKQKGPRRTVRWVVAVEEDTPLRIVASSLKGGTAVKVVQVR